MPGFKSFLGRKDVKRNKKLGNLQASLLLHRSKYFWEEGEQKDAAPSWPDFGSGCFCLLYLACRLISLIDCLSHKPNPLFNQSMLAINTFCTRSSTRIPLAHNRGDDQMVFNLCSIQMTLLSQFSLAKTLLFQCQFRKLNLLNLLIYFPATNCLLCWIFGMNRLEIKLNPTVDFRLADYPNICFA